MFLKNIFKKKKLKFTAYTYFEYSQRMYPIKMAKKQMPELFSATPLYNTNVTSTCPYTKLTKILRLDNKTIRHCDGILDLWANSMVVVAPFDLAINIKDNKVEFTTTYPSALQVVQHDPAQYNKMFPNYVNLKFLSSWRMFSNKNVNCMFTPAFYHMDESIREDVIIAPGTINYKLGPDININMFVKKQFLQKVIHIKAGTPLVYITPMTTEPFELETELIPKENWESRHSGFFSFKSNYKQHKIEEHKENK